MDLIWTNNGVPSPCHFMCAVYFAFGFVAARFFLDRFIFRRLAIWLLCYVAIPLKSNEATRAKIVKWTESMWKSTHYATVELCVLRITYNEPCFKYTKGYFRGWPNQELKLPLKLFYMCPCGFYMYSIAALLTWETRRILHVPLVAHTAQDFSVVMSHHVVTVILIGYSYITSFFQIGSIVLALHDASDVFLEAAKVFKYSEKELGAKSSPFVAIVFQISSPWAAVAITTPSISPWRNYRFSDLRNHLSHKERGPWALLFSISQNWTSSVQFTSWSVQLKLE
ncbi:hypothetical protein ACSBR1_019823 [Camellia fascicularis]